MWETVAIAVPKRSIDSMLAAVLKDFNRLEDAAMPAAYGEL
jgi:hypothetical protein